MKQKAIARLRILYVLLIILISISAVPLGLLGFRMMGMARQTLETQESRLQSTISQSLAREISLYFQGLNDQVSNFFANMVQVASQIDPAQYDTDPRLQAAMESFASDQSGEQPTIIYITVLNREGRGRGVQARGYNVGADDFLRRTLEAAFTAAIQGTDYQSDPITIVRSGRGEPVMVMARPIKVKEQFLGMVGVVVTLAPIVDWLRQTERQEAYVVDNTGRLVASNSPDKNVAGMAMVHIPVVQMFLNSRGRGLRAETSKFALGEGSSRTPMLGTYSPIQSMNWGVIVQRKLSEAYQDIELDTLRNQALVLGVLLIFVILLVGTYSARSITRPTELLTEAARSIAQRDFSKRADIRTRTEIGELAENFNRMADDIQQYIGDLKEASEQNRQLFMDSIEMIAAAVDAKDPYTKGHSGRVSQYSVLLAQELGLPQDEVAKIRIAAILHDVGKIGIEDRILKKPGVLTNEEFEVMKQHTVRGWDIVRPVKQLAEMLPGIRWHHEALNGKGYPDGLAGEKLSLMVRVISAADTFDALTTDRPYQAGRDFPAALEVLRKHVGTKYDPVVVDAMHAAYAKGDMKKFEVRRGAFIAVPEATP